MLKTFLQNLTRVLSQKYTRNTWNHPSGTAAEVSWYGHLVVHFRHDQTSSLNTSAQPHPSVVPSLESEGSSDSAPSGAEEPSGSGFRIRKKRKHPTRLMTVREMKTVWRSRSETHMSQMLKLGPQHKFPWTGRRNKAETMLEVGSYPWCGRVRARSSRCTDSRRISCRESEMLKNFFLKQDKCRWRWRFSVFFVCCSSFCPSESPAVLSDVTPTARQSPLSKSHLKTATPHKVKSPKGSCH